MLVFASVPVGFTLGSIEVVLPAFSEAEGSKELAGVLLASWSLASGVAGLAWGARGRIVPLLRSHMRLAVLLPLAVAPLALATSPAMMIVLALLAGLPIAPLIPRATSSWSGWRPAGTATEAFTWPLTALVAGIALGAAVTGVVVEAGSWSAAVGVAVAVGLGGRLWWPAGGTRSRRRGRARLESRQWERSRVTAASRSTRRSSASTRSRQTSRTPPSGRAR